jgi:[acyl-carrier-protein] S-malonyltransferase
MLFPGQASQYVGMGKDYYDAFTDVRELYRSANRALGFDITQLSFEGDLDELTKTHNAQPAILLHSIAVLGVLTSRGLRPKVVAGHSLGEFSALVAAGVFRPMDALLIVRKRGELMYEAGLEQPGTMAAIIGLVAAVERAIEIAKETGAKRALKLQVSGAFHSPLMQKTAKVLTSYMGKFERGPLRVPWIANVTGAAVESDAQIVDLLSRQLSSPVQWIRSMQTLSGVHDRLILEVGPGKVLSGLMKRIVPGMSAEPLSDVESLENITARIE